MIGSSSDPEEMNEWYVEALPVARKVLATLPMLNAFFKGFEGYESKTYSQSRNFVLVNCLPEIRGQLVVDQLADLIEFEKALGTFGVKDWPRQVLEKLLARMLSDSFDDGLSVFTELRIAHRLRDSFGNECVEIYPRLSNGRISDIAVSIRNNKAFVEIGNLSDSEPERIIHRVLKAGAEHLRPALVGNRYMQVEIDTAHFVFDDRGHMDEQGTIEELNSEVDGLALSLLASLDCSVDIRMASEIVRDMAAYRTTREFLPGYFGEAVGALDTGSLSPWARAANFSVVSEKMLVQSVSSGRAKSPLLEFHVKGFYPSVSAEAEAASFANHIVRHVRSQVEGGQIENGAPNLILVQGYNWVGSILDVGSSLRRVFDAVREMFREDGVPDLAGVALFSRYPSDGYYVHNPATKVSDAEKAVVSSLGLNWVN